MLESAASCGCFTAPHDFLVTEHELGMDEHFGTASLLRCSLCSQRWLMYFYEIEAFTASGRWYLGTVSAEQARHLTAENAKATLENFKLVFLWRKLLRRKEWQGFREDLPEPLTD